MASGKELDIDDVLRLRGWHVEQYGFWHDFWGKQEWNYMWRLMKDIEKEKEDAKV